MRAPLASQGLLLALLAITRLAATSSICTSDPSDQIPDGCTTYGSLEDINKQIAPLLIDITNDTDFFSYYRLDLYGRTCPFWSDDHGMCANIACAVNTIDDEKDIPPVWRAEELSKLEGPKAKHPRGTAVQEPSPLAGALGEDTEESCVVEADECDERDYCVPEDESAGSQGDYVSLKENPERFTGYAGAGAENVWKSIYRENCFLKPAKELKVTTRNPAAQAFQHVLQDKPALELKKDASGKPQLAEIEVDDECLEKRVFYRVISGMHSSISMHLCWDYLNQTTGQWGPNLDCFINRFSGHRDRLQNIYFNYALLVRAVGKLRNWLPQYTFCSGDYQTNRITKAKVMKLANAIPKDIPIFDETAMFQDDMAVLKEDFRNRFRNVSRVMDCVGCDKCRLWGKVQTQGYGTALKILFEFDEKADLADNPPLRRTELVALVNTLGRVSHSLEALGGFEALWEERNRTMELPPIDTAIQKPKKSKKDPRDTSIKQMFKDEWNAVWTVFFFVLRSWYETPRILYTVAKSHVAQRWDIFRGREPRPAQYEWLGWPQPSPRRPHYDSRDEL